MKRTFIIFALVALAHSIGRGATIYDNTVTDTGDSIFFSVGPYSEIGDVIQLGGVERFASNAKLQFFNVGTSGTFAAVLRFYAVGASPASPVGAQIGPDFALTNQTAPSLVSFELTFDTHGVLVPGQFVFTVSLPVVGGGADVGLNLFDPPTVGSSDNTFLVTRGANGFAESTVPNSDANVYFQLTASDAPEPSTMALSGLAVAGLVLFLLGRRSPPAGAALGGPVLGGALVPVRRWSGGVLRAAAVCEGRVWAGPRVVRCVGAFVGFAARSGEAVGWASALWRLGVAVPGLLLPAIPRSGPGPSVGEVDGGRCGKESGVMARHPCSSKPRASGFHLALARNSGQVALRYGMGRMPSMALLCVLCLAAPAASPATSWTLVWADEFNGPANSAPDPTKWKFDLGATGWGNHELEDYTNSLDNVFIDGLGHLAIRAIHLGKGRYTSGRLKTEGLFEVQEGKIEARIQIPSGQVWPAFWMLGNDISRVSWPGCGEIDIMEHISREPQIVHGTLHGPGYSGDRGISSRVALPGDALVIGRFHVFGVEWSGRSIEFLLDGTSYARVTRASLPPGAPWVYNHPFFLLLNLAVGGDWPKNPDETATFPQTMLVDWVRVWRRRAGGL